MWPLSIWNNYVKNKEQKRLLGEKLSWMQIEEMRLSLEWNGLLVVLDHSIVFSSATEVGLSQKYKQFLQLNDKNGRLGCIYAIKKTGLTTLNGSYNLFLSYSQIHLMTGVSLYQYEEVIRKYDEISKEIILIQEQLGKQRLFNLFPR